jgi:hypothetical protein
MRYAHTLRLCAAVLLATVIFAPRAEAQDNLSIYGFFQGQSRYSNEAQTQMTAAGPVESTTETFTFSVQQLNLFFATQFSPSFSAFVNAEIRNTLSTADGFGELRLEEAWARYNYSGAFNVKAGRLLPRFNNLNEIKNRTPLLPYITRPLIYESSFAQILPLDQFVPDQAYLQVYGTVPTGQIRVDYAAYVGNSDQTNLTPLNVGSVVAGSDTTVSKLIGGRLGARWRGFNAGISGTRDARQHGAFDLNGTLLPAPGLGEIARTRVGADFSFAVGRVYGEAEAVQVLYHLDDAQQTALDAVSAMTNGVFSDSFDARFYYGLLGVNITEQLFAYGRYQFYADQSSTAISEGIDLYSVGAGFRPIDAITLKAQYEHVGARENPLFGFDSHYLYGAISVSF